MIAVDTGCLDCKSVFSERKGVVNFGDQGGAQIKKCKRETSKNKKEAKLWAMIS